MKARERIARNLRKFRVKLGLSQELLAADAEVDRRYLSSLERGVENPTIVILERLSSALYCDIRDLFEIPPPGEEAPKPLPGGRRRKTPLK